MHRRDFVFGMLTATAALAVTRTAVAQPTPAGALPTPVYLNMATKGGLFLENTARDAYDKTRNARVKTFARAEVVEQVNLSTKLAPYATAMAQGVASGGAPGPGGLIGGLVAAPLVVAGGVAGATVGAVGGVLGAPQGAGGMTTDEQKAQVLQQLSGMPPSPQYDATFVAASLQGHQEAYAIHGSYAETGEDPALRSIARGALPLIRLHISQLTRMQGMMGGRNG